MFAIPGQTRARTKQFLLRFIRPGWRYRAARYDTGDSPFYVVGDGSNL